MTDSELEWQWLVSDQLLTGNKLNDNERWGQGMAYGIKDAVLLSSVKNGTSFDINC